MNGRVILRACVCVCVCVSVRGGGEIVDRRGKEVVCVCNMWCKRGCYRQSVTSAWGGERERLDGLNKQKPKKAS